MDLAKALKEAETGYSLNLTSTDEAEMLAYISTVLEGVRLEFGNYPTLSFSSLTGDFVPLIGNP